MSEFAGEDQLEGAMAVARMIPATYIEPAQKVREQAFEIIHNG